MVDATVQHFVDDLMGPKRSGDALSRRSSPRRDSDGSQLASGSDGAASSNGASSKQVSCNGSESGGVSSSASAGVHVTQGAQPGLTASSTGQESLPLKVSEEEVSDDRVTAASLVSALDSAASKSAAAARMQQSVHANIGSEASGGATLASEPEPLTNSVSDRAVKDMAKGGVNDARCRPSPAEGEAATAVVVGQERYVVVSSFALLLQHLDALLAFGHVSLALQYEMGSRIAELIRVFNVRSSELLLGAGAIATAGLRSITARHMAVCSQCLLLLEVLLPRLRGVALGGLPAVQVASLASLFEAVSEVSSPPLNSSCSLFQHRIALFGSASAPGCTEW
jgi:hypothetical protein